MLVVSADVVRLVLVSAMAGLAYRRRHRAIADLGMMLLSAVAAVFRRAAAAAETA